MTQTPNIGLKKIDGSENWRNVFDYHNDSMDLADEAFAGVRAGLTYVENGDTIAANANYTAGKFIAWKGEIYRVKATINTTVTSGNWTTYLDKMDGMGGALSQINDDLTSLNSNLMPYHYVDIASNSSVTVQLSRSICLVFGIVRGSLDALMDVYSTLNDASRHIGSSTVLSYSYTSSALTITSTASQNVQAIILG